MRDAAGDAEAEDPNETIDGVGFAADALESDNDEIGGNQMKCNRGAKAAFKLVYFCVTAGLVLGFVSRANAGGPCPFIEENSTPAGSCTWYVQSGAAASVDGGVTSPFNNLAQAQAASNPGDTIIIVSVPTSTPPLDGGIVLQAGQTLAGGNAPGVPGIAQCSNIIQPGPTPPLLFTLPNFPVITTLPTTVPISSGLPSLPRITNTSATGNTGTGDAVTLAPNTTVKNLVIGGADAASQISRGAIYGLDPSGNITITCNDVSYFNTSGTVGFLVQPFYLEQYTPGVANHNGGIKAGWAGIMIDSATTRTNATISNNYVHNGVCGDGIDLRNVVPGNSSAYIQAILTGNYMAFLLQCNKNGIGTLEGIATQTEIGTTGTVIASLVNNVQNSIGSAGANADSLFVNPAGNGPLTEKISNHLFLNGIGGASTNGLEYIIAAGHNTSFVYMTNSVFQQDPGDMLELFNRGNDGSNAGTTASLILNNVIVQKTSITGGLPAYANPPGGVGSTKLASSPDNTGECLGIGSVGGGDVSLLQMTNTTFTGCGNDGIEVTNNYATGDGPVADDPQTIVLDIINSRISGSLYYNLWVNNISPLTTLNVKVQNSDLSASTAGVGVGFDSFFGYAVANANIDLGGGPLGSTGSNCFFPRSFINDLETTTTTTISGVPTPPPAHPVSSQYTPVVYAENDWWGGSNPTFSSGATNVPGFQIFTTQPAAYATVMTTPSLTSVPLCGPGPGSGPGPQQVGLD